MKKLFLIALTVMSLHAQLSAQCALAPLSLEYRVNAATVIVEAQVSAKTSYWNSEKTMIYTANSIRISTVLKGSGLLSDDELNIITLGGLVGDKAVRVDPELELEVGEIGIFMLVQKDGNWVSESGPQGCIRIDKYTAEASDVFNTYPSYSIQSKIKAITGLAIVDVQSALTKIIIQSKRTAPIITSIAPTSITAGTTSILTIKGANFNSTRDTGSVQFRNGDDGGKTFVKALKRDYISWSDTMIRLIVRTQAGTGKIRVVAAATGNGLSGDTLKISFSHLNVVSADTLGYETQQIGMNSNNGITWKMNKRFYDSSGAKAAFIRSLERWRCGTYINWDTLGTVNYSAIKSDGVNMCAWDTSNAMGSGVLAQCFSFWSGCFNPGLKWFVNELDIRFRIKPTDATNWNYTSGNATSTQFHFESVATHELGHGHQMGHVINSPVVMHFSIANGQTKPSLSNDDISAGNYVINKSSSGICGKNAHTKLNSGNCAIVAPTAKVGLSKYNICLQESIQVIDSSVGNISAWAWNFGANASPATANTKGPHNVQYSTGGAKTITLTITTINGNLNVNKSISIKNDLKMSPAFTFIAKEKGIVTFTNNSNNPSSTKWYFGDGDSSTQVSPTHQYSAGGSYSVKLVSTNTCNSDDSTQAVNFAWLNFAALNINPCIDEVVTYIDSSDAQVNVWNWTFIGGTPSTASGKGPHKVVYNSSGIKTSILSISSPGAPTQSYTQPNIVQVGTDTFTRANFTFGYYGKNIVGFDNKSTGTNMNYKWYFGDGDSSTEKNPVHTYTSANNQIVKLVVNGDCNSSDTIKTLRDFTNIHSSLTWSFNLYPNPSNAFVQIQTNLKESFMYDLCDLSGKIILSNSAVNGDLIDLRHLPTGTYLFKAYSESDFLVYQLIIKNQ